MKFNRVRPFAPYKYLVWFTNPLLQGFGTILIVVLPYSSYFLILLLYYMHRSSLLSLPPRSKAMLKDCNMAYLGILAGTPKHHGAGADTRVDTRWWFQPKKYQSLDHFPGGEYKICESWVSKLVIICLPFTEPRTFFIFFKKTDR